MAVSFHLDENMPQAVADGLRKRGRDVTTSEDAGLLGAGDEEQLAFSHAAGRVIVTRDQDFLRFNQQGIEHSGIVFWAQRQRTLGQLVRALDTLAVDRTADELKNQVTFL